MARPLRYLPPECPLVEVTCRTLQGRMLLRPSRALNEILVGIVARAARRYDVGVCAFVFLSNHCHLLLRPTGADQLSAFMNYVNSNVAREAGRLHRWRDKFWGRRYHPVAISFEPQAQIARLRYLLEQGCKENLVARPEQWPGASSVRALLGDGTVIGIWHDRTAACRARRGGERLDAQRFRCTESLVLQPLPCWDGLPAETVRTQVLELVTAIVAAARRRRRRTGKRPLGVRRILRQHPHSRPRTLPRSEAPRFHAATWQIRKLLEAMYRAYREAYAEAAMQLRRQIAPVRFPPHGIPPPQAATMSA